jgi:hypothetical protein
VVAERSEAEHSGIGHSVSSEIVDRSGLVFEPSHDQIGAEVLALALGVDDIDEFDLLARGSSQPFAWLKRQTLRHKRAEIGSSRLVDQAIAVQRSQ